MLRSSGDLFEFVTSGSRGWAQFYTDTGPLFVRIGNLDHDTISLDLKERQHVKPPTNSEGQRTRLRAGDILISITAELGMVGLVPDNLGEAYINQHIALARPRAGLDARFLAWFFASAGKRQLLDMRRGVTKAGLGLDDIRGVSVGVPPLNEQRRIVTKLEALQARSRRAREALDAVPPLLEKLRQSILAAAFRGDLTKDWRAKHKDVEPASELLKRIRTERRKKWEDTELAKMKAKGKPPTDDKWKAKYKEPEPVDTTGLPELPEGWCVVELGEVVWRLTNGYVGPTRNIYVEEGVPYLLSKHVKKNVLRFDGATFITKEFNQRNRKSILNTGDVLLVQTGHVGDSAVVPPEHEGHNCHAMIVISPLEEVLDGNYLSLFFGSPTAQRAFGAIEKGMTLRHLNCHDVIHLATVVPPLEEQRAIVARTEKRLADLAALRSVLLRQREGLERLDRSTLAKAFRGELVPQDPNDEPAEAMLARVREATAGAFDKAKKRSAATARRT